MSATLKQLGNLESKYKLLEPQNLKEDAANLMISELFNKKDYFGDKIDKSLESIAKTSQQETETRLSEIERAISSLSASRSMDSFQPPSNVMWPSFVLRYAGLRIFSHDKKAVSEDATKHHIFSYGYQGRFIGDIVI